MEKEQININVEAGVKTLEIRQGKAPELHTPQGINISGRLDTVSLFIANRKDTFHHLKAFVIICREKGIIELVINEDCQDESYIKGGILANPDLLKFCINQESSFTTHELANVFKMNRACFEKPEVAMNLSYELQNFKAKVEKEIEKLDDKRGNVRNLCAQVIESNIPESFRLSIPVYKGGDIETFAVEILIRADNYNCCLISPELNDIIRNAQDRIFDAEIAKIQEISDDILIVEK